MALNHQKEKAFKHGHNLWAINLKWLNHLLRISGASYETVF